MSEIQHVQRHTDTTKHAWKAAEFYMVGITTEELGVGRGVNWKKKAGLVTVSRVRFCISYS